MPGIVLGAEVRAVNKQAKIPAIVELTFWCKKTRLKEHLNKIISDSDELL